MLLNLIEPALIDWSRAQFALTACYHWLFVPLTLGLAVVMAIMETLYVIRRDPFWKRAARFWMKLFGINFAVGVATGLILEFEFGTNWSNYSWFVGDIFGAPLAIEGIVAFFMEATFIAVMYFGWNKVSRGFHLAATWLTGVGATLSAWWILVANSWMQHPVGMQFNPDTVRNEMMDFFAVAFSPVAVVKFCHTVLSGWLTGAVFVAGVSCWYLLRRREQPLAFASLRIATVVGLVAALGATVVLTPAAQGMQGALDKAEELAKQKGGYIANQFANPANPRAHELTTAQEIIRDTDGKVDIFVSAVGTGGTLSGTGRVLKANNKDVKVIAVEPAASPLLTKGYAGPHAIQGIGANFVPDALDKSVIDEIIDVEDDRAKEVARELALAEGLLCGISSGAALAAAIEVAKREENEGKRIVVILPDGGERYMSTGLFD